jgi:hypothetical protein
MLVPPEAQGWAENSGLAIPPVSYDILQAPPAREGLEITSPAIFAQISGEVTIRGSATGEGFSYYRLQYGQGLNPSAWVLIGENVSTPGQRWHSWNMGYNRAARLVCPATGSGL